MPQQLTGTRRSSSDRPSLSWSWDEYAVTKRTHSLSLTRTLMGTPQCLYRLKCRYNCALWSNQVSSSARYLPWKCTDKCHVFVPSGVTANASGVWVPEHTVNLHIGFWFAVSALRTCGHKYPIPSDMHIHHDSYHVGQNEAASQKPSNASHCVVHCFHAVLKSDWF